MDNLITITAYHSSLQDGGWSFVWNETPFFSKAEGAQTDKWLTDGYYFWTDSDHFAHDWGQKALKGNYAVVECQILLCSDEFLDLVGNVEDQIYFRELVTRMQQKRKGQAHETTIPQAIKWARENGFFPFKAVKAFDQPKDHLTVPFGKGRECIVLPTRQQLCVYEESKESIRKLGFTYPKEFSDAVQTRLALKEVDYETKS